MPNMLLKTRTDVEDFVKGCAFYGTGGGGDVVDGINSLMKLIEAGKDVGWVDVDEISDDDNTICPFLMGSIAPITEESIKEMAIFGLNVPKTHMHEDTLATSVTALENIHGKKVAALVPIELGGANAPACIAASAIKGIVTVDGDYTGRAIPEIQQTTPFIYEKELLPITTCDAWGNTCTIEKANSWRMAERTGKLIATSSYSAVGEAGFFMSGKDTKDIIIRDTMTECYELGKLIRETRESGDDPIKAAVDRLNGWVLCRGTVTKKEWWDSMGYYWGNHTITGTDDYSGTEIKIWFKNENHVSWKNGDTYVTSPDMLIVADAKTGEAYTNNLIKEGMEVVVIGVKARDVFRSERGLLTLGPKAFGFDIDYKPIEDMMG